jgi:hypothetical protein
VTSTFSRPTAAPTAVPTAVKEGLCAGALLLIFAILAVGSLQRMTLTADEESHYGYGWKLLHFDASRGDDNSKMAFSALNALPRRIVSCSRRDPRSRLETVEFGRYVTVVCALFLAWLVYRWARALYGPAAGLLALTLYVFEPNILAHAGLVTTDLYATWMTALAVWSFWRLLNHEGPGVWRVATVSAIVFAVAQLAKYTSAHLAPILILIAGGHAAPEPWMPRARRAVAGPGRADRAAGKYAPLRRVVPGDRERRVLGHRARSRRSETTASIHRSRRYARPSDPWRASRCPYPSPTSKAWIG